MKGVIPLIVLLATNYGASACGFDDGTGVALENGHLLHYRIKNPPLPLARHFAMQFQLCHNGKALPLEGFKIDASMPRHGHGMNYRAEINPLGRTLVEADGLLFHMPGLWQINLEFSSGDSKHRVELEYQI